MNVQTIWDNLKEKHHAARGQTRFPEDVILAAMVETRLQLTKELVEISHNLKLAAIIQEIAELDPTYESEYAHRMETFCFFCDSQDEHKTDCLHKRLKEALRESTVISDR